MTLKDYIGNEQAVEITRSYIQQFPSEKRALILTGPPGIGKTFLIKCFSSELNIPLDSYNTSSFKRKDEIKQILLNTQLSEPRLILLDECENIPTKHLTHIIKDTCQPLFLCCNYIEDIDWKVREMCIQVKIKKPPWWIFRDYMKTLNPDIPDDLAKTCTSFRHAQRLIEDPEDEGSSEILSPYDQVERSLHFGNITHFDMNPETLIHWINDNSHSPDEVSLADIFLKRTQLSSNYKFWRYTYNILSQIRSTQKIEYPYSFIIMSNIKKDQKSEKPTPSKELVTIIIDETDTTEDEIIIPEGFNDDTPTENTINHTIEEWI